jgi:hypothetical protein
MRPRSMGSAWLAALLIDQAHRAAIGVDPTVGVEGVLIGLAAETITAFQGCPTTRS